MYFFSKLKFIVFSVLFYFLFLSTAYGGTFYFEYGNEDKGTFTGLSELFYGGPDQSDGNFTQGLYLSYTDDLSEDSKLTYSLEQDLFSPYKHNKRKKLATPGDRPFAGYLGGGVVYHKRSNYFSQKLGLKVGMIGPSARGDQVQNFLHDHLISADEYSGWNDQVKDKVGLSGQYMAALKLQTTCGVICFELAPHISLVASNLIAYEGAGATFRIGNHLDKDYGPAIFSPLSRGEMLTDHKGVSWYVLAGYEKRRMRKNYLLDGVTSISDIPTLTDDDIEKYVADKHIGFGANLGGVALDFTFVERSREFKQQDAQQFIRVGLGIPI